MSSKNKKRKNQQAAFEQAQEPIKQTQQNYSRQLAEWEKNKQQTLAQMLKQQEIDQQNAKKMQNANQQNALNSIKCQAARLVGGTEYDLTQCYWAWLGELSQGLDEAHKAALQGKAAHALDVAMDAVLERVRRLVVEDLPHGTILDIDNANINTHRTREFIRNIVRQIFGEIKEQLLGDLAACVQDILAAQKQKLAQKQDEHKASAENIAQIQNAPEVTRQLCAAADIGGRLARYEAAILAINKDEI